MSRRCERPRCSKRRCQALPSHLGYCVATHPDHQRGRASEPQPYQERSMLQVRCVYRPGSLSTSSSRGNARAHHDRYRLQRQPKLVDIINAVPQEHKKAVLPYIKAKPVRTASGVCEPRIDKREREPRYDRLQYGISMTHTMCVRSIDRCGGSHVQAAPMPAYRHDGQHLRLLPRRPRLGL